MNARFGGGSHHETPLHWVASSDDVEVLDTLLDLGADIEADGGVIAGGTPLADAWAFGQWRAAHRLVERGARTTIADAATLGLQDRLEGYFAGSPPAPDGSAAPSGRLPRRPARLRRVPPGPGRGAELGPALRAAHPGGRGHPQRRRGPGRVAARPGGQAVRQAGRHHPHRPSPPDRNLAARVRSRLRQDHRWLEGLELHAQGPVAVLDEADPLRSRSHR